MRAAVAWLLLFAVGCTQSVPPATPPSTPAPPAEAEAELDEAPKPMTADEQAMVAKAQEAVRPYGVMAQAAARPTGPGVFFILEGQGLTDANAAEAAERLGATGVPLMGLEMVAGKLSAESLAKFYSLPNIREMNLDTPVQLAAFRSLKAAPPVELLSIANPSAADLERVAAVPNLRSLQVLDAGKPVIPAVAKLRGLEYLNVMSQSLTDADIAPLSALTKLKSVGVAGSKLTPAVAGTFAGAPVTRFLFDPMKITDAGLAEVAKLKGVTQLRLAGASLTDAGFARLENLGALEELTLENVPGVTAAGVAHLAKLPKLRALTVVNAPGAGPLAGLAGAPALAKLTTVGVDAKVIATAGRLPKLRALAVQGVPVNSLDLAALAPTTRLTLLEIRPAQGKPVTDAGARAIAQIKTLETLYLPEAKLTDIGVAALGTMPNLKLLSIAGTSFDPGEHTPITPVTKRGVLPPTPRADVSPAGFAELVKAPKLKRLILGPETSWKLKPALRELAGGRVSVE